MRMCQYLEENLELELSKIILMLDQKLWTWRNGCHVCKKTKCVLLVKGVKKQWTTLWFTVYMKIMHWYLGKT